MPEIINAYLNTTSYIVIDVVYNIIAVVVVVAVVLFLISASRASVGDSDIRVLVFATVCIILAVIGGVCLYVLKSPAKEELKNQIVPAIEETYHIQVYNKDKVLTAITSTSSDDKNIKIKSQNPNNDTTYFARLVEQDGEWKLCKVDDDGKETELSKEHAISDLKGE